MSRLSHEMMLTLHDAVTSAGLAGSRGGLLAGLSHSFIATLPTVQAPGEQLLSDINALNEAGHLADKTIPILLWIRNAVALAGPRKESVILKRIQEIFEDALPQGSGRIVSDPQVLSKQGGAPSLDIVDGPLQGQTLLLDAGNTYVLGRDPRAHLQLPDGDPKVSRNHVLIEVTPGAIVARDLRSKNGFFVNERRVTTAVLQSGDRLRIGRTSLRLSIPGYEAPVTPEAAASTETDSAAGETTRENQDSARTDDDSAGQVSKPS